jgi:triphosphoribosyl-dephospho-CoA synthetase
MEQDDYQRVVPFLSAGLLFKDAYALGAEAEKAEECAVESQSVSNDVCRIAELVCQKLAVSSWQTYVGRGKRSEDVFEKYMNVVKEILLSEFGNDASDGLPYFNRLRALMPGLTKAAYTRQHRAALEYLARRAKNQMREALREM